MASSSRSARCIRLLETAKDLSCGATRQTGRAFHQQRSLHTPAPLHLNFLAPSWQQSPLHSGPTPRSISRRPQSQRPQQRQHRRHLSLSLPRPQSKAILNPRQDDSGNDMLVHITPRAAHRLSAIASKDQTPDLALRVSVESGGCHGFQYLMNLTKMSEVEEGGEDTVFEDEASGARVVMDEPSLELLKGSSVDYTMELIGSQFKVVGIPGAKSSCGCGTSFDIA